MYRRFSFIDKMNSVSGIFGAHKSCVHRYRAKKRLFADAPSVWVRNNDLHGWFVLSPNELAINDMVFKIGLGVLKEVPQEIRVNLSQGHPSWQR